MVPTRLWRLGRAAWLSRRWEVYFARRLWDRDGLEILRDARVPASAVVFTPERTLGHKDDGKRQPLVLPLSQIVRDAGGDVQFEHAAVEDRLEDTAGAHLLRPRTVRRRASRTADIEALTAELREHVRAARDYARDTRDRSGRAELLPRPAQAQLAQRAGVTASSACRCFKDPSARELQFLWELADDLDRVAADAP